MNENKKQLIEEIKDLLQEISEKGIETVNILKEKHKTPTTIYSNFRSINGIFLPRGYADAKMLIKPDLFNILLFENFWHLFKIVKDNIENPLVQPWIRVIIEQFSDIFYYSQKSEIEKKEIACKYWLCALGFIGGKQGNLKYEDFLESLDNKRDKVEFLKIKEKGYPIEKIHQKWYKLFGLITNKETIPDIIENYLLNIKGNSIKKEQLIIFYRDMSLYHHPNIIIKETLQRDFNNKSHIFRCFTLISIFGLGMIKFSVEKTIKKEKISLFDFYKRVGLLMKKLH